jgi:hypothetical protein
MSELNENVIIHFITRQCPEEELKQINEWLAEDQRHAQYLLQMERIYQHLQSRSMPQWKVEEALERVHGNAGAALPHQERHSFRRRWHRYAAAIVLAILAGTALLWYGKVLRADDGRAYIVPKTFTAMASFSTIKGLVLSLETSKYPSPVSNTLRTSPSKRSG